MVPFSEAESDRFFGREQEVREAVERLHLHPFLTIIGPSGSGKSSLVFAGLLPALRRSTLFGPGRWLVRRMRPGEKPLTTLARTLGVERVERFDLPTLLATQPEASRFLLIVDQFEELFTLGAEEASACLQALLDLTQRPDCYLVLTVRADFYPDLMTTVLWPQIQSHRLEVLPLSEEGLRRAIVRPAADVGVFVEPALVERLVADAAGEPGALPLVQETLVLLWDRLERRFLPLSAYEALGGEGRTGLQVAMARRADAALAALTPEQRAIARRIFLRLIQFGEGRPDTRRRQPIAALRSAEDDPRLFGQTLRHLADHRLLTLSGEAEDEERLVDIAHEALITGWPTLQQWVAEWREAEQIRRRLEAKATEWVRLGRGSGGLLDAVELREAERWLASPDAADLGYDATLSDLVEASRAALEAAEREREAARRRELMLERRARRRLQGLVVLLSLIVLAGGGWFARLELLRQRARAAGAPIPIPGLGIAFERYEVTNGRYHRCVQAGRCSEPPPQLSTYFRPGADGLPMTGVDALQAAAFCRWIGRRLPTLAEWEHAATQGRRTSWPWGEDAPTPARANLDYDQDGEGEPEAVGSHPQGATPEGVQDLIGNVAEWTATPWTESGPAGPAWNGHPASVPDVLTIAGGSYLFTPGSLSLGEPADSSFRSQDIGFRCVEGKSKGPPR